MVEVVVVPRSEGLTSAVMAYVQQFQVSEIFDEPIWHVDELVSMQVMELAEQRLSRFISEHVDLPSTRSLSGAVNAGGKLTAIIAGMVCRRGQRGRCGRLARRRHAPDLRRGVIRPRLGDLAARVHLRPCQPARSGGPEHLAAPRPAPRCCPASSRGVFGHRLAAAPRLRTRRTGGDVRARQDRRTALLRKGLSPVVTTLSAPQAAPVIAEA